MTGIIGTPCATALRASATIVLVFQAPRATRVGVQSDQPYFTAILSASVYY